MRISMLQDRTGQAALSALPVLANALPVTKTAKTKTTAKRPVA
jgi:hypothetical protein